MWYFSERPRQPRRNVSDFGLLFCCFRGVANPACLLYHVWPGARPPASGQADDERRAVLRLIGAQPPPSCLTAQPCSGLSLTSPTWDFE